MRAFTRLLVALGSGVIATSAIAKDKCPPDTLGPNYPWLTDEIMPGDQFAEVYLDFDKAGQPSGCRLGNNNIPRDDRFNVCLAFAGFTINPQSTISLPTTVKRNYLELGGRHLKVQRDARKKFFADHRDLRPDCYPGAD